MTHDRSDQPERQRQPPAKPLSPAAQRALAEADERRRCAESAALRDDSLPPEFGGRDGLDPVRFGDWEKNGIAWDF